MRRCLICRGVYGGDSHFVSHRLSCPQFLSAGRPLRRLRCLCMKSISSVLIYHRDINSAERYPTAVLRRYSYRSSAHLFHGESDSAVFVSRSESKGLPLPEI